MSGDLLKTALKFAQEVQSRPFKDRCLRYKVVPNADRVEEYASGINIFPSKTHTGGLKCTELTWLNRQ